LDEFALDEIKPVLAPENFTVDAVAGRTQHSSSMKNKGMPTTPASPDY
jgi:hypothetical protein